MGGIVSGIFGGGDSSAPSQPNIQVYQPTGTAGADTNIQNLLNSNTTALTGSSNPYSQLSPQILQAFETLFNNSGTSGYATGAANSGTALTNVGNQAVNASAPLNTAALGLLPGAAQVYNLGLDPQSALYNQQLQKTNDQANVTNAQYGLTGQQAAGNTQQADTNFNIDWQNQQLSRALAGLSGAGTAISNASGNAINASNLGTTGANNILAGGAAPYNAQQTVGSNQETALTQYLSQLLGPVTSTQSTIGDLSGYLGQGINASASGATAGLNDYYAQLQNSANAGSGIGAIGNALGLGNGGAGNLISSIFGGSGGGSAAESLATSQLGDSFGPAAIASSGGIGDFLSTIGSLFAFA